MVEQGSSSGRGGGRRRGGPAKGSQGPGPRGSRNFSRSGHRKPAAGGRDGQRRDDRGERGRGGQRRDDRPGTTPDRRRFPQGERSRRPEERDRDRERRIPSPGTAPAVDEPPTPKEFDESLLPVGVRAELKGLPKDLAETIAAHLLAAGTLLDEDPDLAYRHAAAAKRRAGRLAVVREATAEAAYASGRYEIALREFRAIRRMNGGDELLPVLADCERALGRHREALDLLATLDPRTKNLGLRIECLLVEAGIRSDLGQRGEALRLLRSAISHRIGPRQGQARLRYAYADLLEADGQVAAAREWFDAAARLDPDGLLDVSDRIAVLDGVTLPDDFVLEGPEEAAHPEPDPEDVTETEVIELVSPEEEIAELLAEIDGEDE
ncbi:MAG: tetratricopeptide repeat protein [Arachnia propionica]|uniref:tetratricopeptide repeat protein n=1 Tax=Arachnia propionica TaxID=1750 RepID=UPI002705F5E6|nr:tetratricopeptide repeat protein [Arachnia propionica]